ncbi:ATP-binding cassette domain-containing protein [Brevibacterium marinum]|uniref:ABC-type dipeptide/oligopeptide/nickel transport system ATPase component n=1 Tax=Brevibacterium marinum TaxID=418643 RepID=A0A846RSI8_9MICO|nr:ABC transporter ATP-binding protein [Brevibacterium marinum]NJC57024.1 ABC-type dipeptide/oligopeptide/nickel transport system ATPase component [Brevibacterium marinum]
MNTATINSTATDEAERGPEPVGADESPILSVKNLSVKFQDNTAVDDVSFDVSPREVLAIVGESGSGKSVTSLAIMRLVELSSSGKVTDGQMRFTRAGGEVVDLRTAPEAKMRTIRGNDISMIFQEPLTSLNPVYSVGNQLAEVLRVHKGMSRREAKKGVIELMERVRIPEPERRARQYPHQMSGGMRQRVVIAMALACQPRILIADEPTTALDVTIQAQILALLRELKNDLDAGIIFITHDMGVVAEIADRVLVMRKSQAIETGQVGDIFARPRQPYTKNLLSAVPKLGAMNGTDSPALFHLDREEAS